MAAKGRHAIDWLTVVISTIAGYLVKDFPPFASILRRLKRSKIARAFATVSFYVGMIYAMSLAAVVIVPQFLILTSDDPFGSVAISSANLGLNDFQWAGILTVISMVFLVGSMRDLRGVELPNNQFSEAYLY